MIFRLFHVIQSCQVEIRVKKPLTAFIKFFSFKFGNKWKLRITVKLSQNSMLNGSLKIISNIKIIRLFLNRYLRLRPGVPPNFSFKIFPKVYNITSFYDLQTNEHHEENRKEILNKAGGTYSILANIKKKARAKIKNVRILTQPRRGLYNIAYIQQRRRRS